MNELLTNDELGGKLNQLADQVRGGISHSATIGALAAALAKAQSAFKPVVKDSTNPFFKSKYADLSTVIEATRAALSANNLVVIQTPRTVNGSVVVTTMLIHSSGEWLRDDLTMPVTKQDAQGVGSAITYARRYAYQAVLNIAAEVDDDANLAADTANKIKQPALPERPPATGKATSPQNFKSTNYPPPKNAPPRPTFPTMTEEEAAELEQR